MMSRRPPGDSRSSPGNRLNDRTPTSKGITTRKTFGDWLGPKQSRVFRGISCQLGGLPINRSDPAYQQLLERLFEYQVDVAAMQEIGINFSKCPVAHQWKDRLMWNTIINPSKAKTIVAWNKTDLSNSVAQYGGTAILALTKTSHYAAGSGSDPTNLGRWCWTRYRGSRDVYFRIVSFYRPCDGPGNLTVAAQHLRYFREQNDDRDPRTAFLEDFHAELLSWIAAGDLLVVCGDINDDILNDTIKEFFGNLGLRHLIFSKHNPTTSPPTFIRTQSKRMVDGIWASPSFTIYRETIVPYGLTFPTPKRLEKTCPESGDHKPGVCN